MATDSKHCLEFALQATDDLVSLTDFTAIVAGYTGRDKTAVQAHIDELAAIGVAPPSEIPMFYSMPNKIFTNQGGVNAGTTLTSGEVEPLYVRHAGNFYLGVGSDHTDRDLETIDIGESKRACAKPVSKDLIRIGNLAELSLDDCTARCWVDGTLYQEGTLAGLRPPHEIVDLMTARLGLRDEDFVCLGGTLPLLDGNFVRGTEWRIRIDLSDGRFLEHSYRCTAS